MVGARPDDGLLDRREAVAGLLRNRGGLLVVCGPGSPSYDVHSVGDFDTNFYLWGAMGGAALLGLGLPQARIDRQVLVVTGDGEQLMGLGGLATIGVARPGNLMVAVLDTERFGETGSQGSHTGRGVDLASVASGCGFVEVRTVRDLVGVEAMREALHRRADGPRLFVLKVRPVNVPRWLPPRDAVHLKNRFRAQLGLAVS